MRELVNAHGGPHNSFHVAASVAGHLEIVNPLPNNRDEVNAKCSNVAAVALFFIPLQIKAESGAKS